MTGNETAVEARNRARGPTPSYLPHQRGRFLSTRRHNRGQPQIGTSPMMGEVGRGWMAGTMTALASPS